MSSEKGTRVVLDKSRYMPRTISTFNIISAYVTDIYYNHLYSEAMKMKAEGKTNSITEGYRHAIWAFINAINPDSGKYKEHHYKQLLKGINEYFTIWTSFSTLNLRDCINKVTQEFVPEDYFVNLDNDQRSNIIRKVLTNSIKEFSLVIIHEYLNGIIDNHDETANIEALKDCMTDILLMEREAMFRKFLDQNIGKKSETIDKSVGIKMQQEIKSLLKDRDALHRNLAECKKLVNERDKQLLKVIDSYKKLNIKHKGLIEEYQALKIKTETLYATTAVVNTAVVNTPVVNTPVVNTVRPTAVAKQVPIDVPEDPESDEPSSEEMNRVLKQHEKKKKKVTIEEPVEPDTPEEPEEQEEPEISEPPEKKLEEKFKRIVVPKQELGDAPKFDEFDDPF